MKVRVSFWIITESSYIISMIYDEVISLDNCFKNNFNEIHNRLWGVL